MEDWRTFLYPLGFLSSLPFTARFFLQWLTSEVQKKSTVTKSFWILSLAGNLLLAFHAFIQIQYHIFALQICNGIISWRNLNLMQPEKKQYNFSSVIIAFVILLIGATFVFTSQFLWLDEPLLFFRSPQYLGTGRIVSPLFHAIGSVGILLFTSRFWIQWWQAERHKTSLLTSEFWILSFFGAILSVLYFFAMGDPVNAIGPAVGILPYVRNLVLLKKYGAHSLSRLP